MVYGNSLITLILNSFVLSPQKRIKSTNAIGITSKSGRYGGTYAHSDIAFEFASCISPEFKLYIIKDYQRLKLEEATRLEIGWDTKREQSYTYANEADILNIALFGKTAKQWREETGNQKLNMRDVATVEQLIVLVNLESLNADLIRQNIPKPERLQKLRSVAYYQLRSLENSNAAKHLILSVFRSKYPLFRLYLTGKNQTDIFLNISYPSDKNRRGNRLLIPKFLFISRISILVIISRRKHLCF